MRSRHVDEFNHDPWAVNYDEHVRDEADPIRTGYAEVLAWTAAQAAVAADHVVIDLGAGTGNTSAQFPVAGRVICVDVSARMLTQAKPKLAHLARVDYVYADLLEYALNSATRPAESDAVISTYAIHHLTEAEKPALFAGIYDLLKPGGRAVFGDLMFQNRAAEMQLAAEYIAAGRPEVAVDFDEEFFWYVDDAVPALEKCGFHVVEVKRFSTLSWGIATVKP